MVTISQQPNLEGFGSHEYDLDEEVQQYYSTESSSDQYSSAAASSQMGNSGQSQLSDQKPKIAKKTNHNASERDRRKKINDLYLSLCSLLPAAHREKKLSIPTTVSRVLKYIPELLKEAEGLAKKKESLLRRNGCTSDSDLENSAPLKKACNSRNSASLDVVSATQTSEGEVMIQIATTRLKNWAQGEVVSRLEQDGLVLLNSSCVQSFHGRLFYNLHLQANGSHQALDVETLKKQLVSFLEHKEAVSNQPVRSKYVK